ncbi:cellulase family glycosylhydrolase [Gandjariella thermophila]|uniref:Endoglycosylceramidase n=1 Tax=Gandjariella thermophila TaxID=1931992 RepID=A0A4D4J7Y7_9PSEU|nr:cellulase family glycosylhydrolase [Gandjariella thermophila]GDY31140.1 endoglycosylceramidase [Gandjariella thermophila]
MIGRLARAGVAALVLPLLGTLGVGRAAAQQGSLWFDGPASQRITVGDGQVLRDGYGREVVLRGFNVSGEAKLAEHGGLPFADAVQAGRAAADMRRLTGANAVRFLVTWARTEPVPKQIDHGYLDQVAAQVAAFRDQGIRVYLDFHEDLYSRYLFRPDSWYTGDGAPQWVIDAGHYPPEFCVACLQWGQNLTNNAAVRAALHDFWHNRVLDTAAGPIAIRDEFLAQAGEALRYLREHLSAEQFAGMVGVDPLNEPYAGDYDSGQSGDTWERDLAWPFYQQFRRVMDDAGWVDRPELVEPEVFWNVNIPLVAQPGGFTAISGLGSRYVFNAHVYDARAQSGVLMPGKAGDGQELDAFNTIRDRAADLGTAALVSEFGHPLGGFTSDKAPSVDKAMYQALDSRVAGANWWRDAARSGPPLSASQWHWDVYSGRHHEPMNGNPGKIQTDGDAFNGEDYSSVRTEDAGGPQLRQDTRLLDRVFPRAVAGTTLAFSYEDRSRDGGTEMVWNQIPADLPNLRALVGTGQFGVLVWRGAGTTAPTELHLPAGFDPAATTVVSDLGAVTGLPGYAGGGTPVAVAAEPGPAGVNRLLLSTSDTGVHVALVTNGPAPPAESRAAAQRELTGWAASTFG